MDTSEPAGDGSKSIWRPLLTILWALIPVLTLGLGTVPLMAFAAVRMRSRAQAVATLPYVATTAVLLAADRDVSTTQEVLFDTALAISMFVGSAHAFAIRPSVWGRRDPEEIGLRSRRLQDRQREALAAHADAEAARQKAREIAENDPQQAYELRIGRPDIADRAFPDGGLIDVNNVPVQVIASSLQLSNAEAEAVARTRARVGGFSSVADLSVTMDLAPRRLDPIASRLVFLPTRQRR